MKEEYNIGDLVYCNVDEAPFTVVGIRSETIELKGDWSGGTHNVCQVGWISKAEVMPYHKAKIKTY